METILLIWDLTHDYPLLVSIWQCNMAFTHGEIACQHLSRSDFDLCLPTGGTYISATAPSTKCGCTCYFHDLVLMTTASS